MATMPANDTTNALPSPEGRTMGHLALHYGPAGDGPAAARLLSLLGLVETQMLPLPQGNFYRFVVNADHFARGDGIVYLSALPEPQVQLIAAMRAALGIGTAQEHPAVAAYHAMLTSDPEASFHFGFLVPSLEDLEELVLILRHLAESDPEFRGRIKITANRARRGDAAVDARLDASPVFGDCSRFAYGRNGVQVFIETDLVKAGQLGECMHFELDYVFPGAGDHILSVVEM